MMECRHDDLKDTVETLTETNVSLIAKHHDVFGLAGFADDQGIYYFIPQIVKTLGVSLDVAINLFFGSLLVIGAAVMICCFFAAFKNWILRLISAAGILLLTLLSYLCSDVYITYFFAVAATIPIFVLHTRQSHAFDWRLIVSLAFCGTVIGYCNIIRSHSGTGVLLFLIIWTILNQNILKFQKIFSILALVLFILLPNIHFHIMENKRDQFLTTTNYSFEYISSHPKWHSLYIGLGYIKNKYGIEYDDLNAYKKTLSINPNVKYCSREYEQILKDQVLLILKKDPFFVLKSLASKLIPVMLITLAFFNFGLFFYFYVKPPFKMMFPFIVAGLFYSLFGILTIPSPRFLLGMISIWVILGIYLIGLGLEKFRNEKNRLKDRPLITT